MFLKRFILALIVASPTFFCFWASYKLASSTIDNGYWIAFLVFGIFYAIHVKEVYDAEVD